MAYTTIDDPSAYFQTLLYTGDGSDDRNLVNTGNSDLQPDWIWNKRRDSTSNHFIFDSSRGTSKILATDSTEAEGTNTNQLQAFQTDGFQLGSDNGSNGSSRTMVAWQWKANGGTTSSNSDGTITSTVQANTTAGFSIVTYTGTGSNATIGHGLGAVPNVIIIKQRSGAGDWTSFHEPLGSTKFLRLNSTIAAGTQSTYFQDTDPTSTVFSVGSAGDVNTSSGTHVAYCFAEKQGYSKFGSYTGNGNADGPFVYTGFSPAWVMIKGTSSGREWFIFDNRRDTYNPFDSYVKAEASDAEADHTTGDFLSNGFKIRNSGSSYNTNGQTFIYMAFAESPFVSSEGVPTTAR